MVTLLPSQAALAELATGRSDSLFRTDWDACYQDIVERLDGAHVLVIGGAGSIGAATVRLLSGLQLACLHVVDHAENSLVELVRDLRGRPDELAVKDFHCLPLDFGSHALWLFLSSSQPYDLVFNFAAMKHVRSEKDVFSLLEMIDTNVLKQAHLLRQLERLGFGGTYFSVSTDKAANPVSLMGATKRLMEHVMFSEEIVRNLAASIVSARFANVAFSDGSLLHGFLYRFSKRQPIAVPRQTERYFLSLEEAAQLCVLACLRTPHRTIAAPRLSSGLELEQLEAIAASFVRFFGLEPKLYCDEGEACRAVEADLAKGCYPLLLTPLDTSGEKPYEEFVGRGETVREIGLNRLIAINYRQGSPGATSEFITGLTGLGESNQVVTKEDLVNLITTVVPELRHEETGLGLDQRL